jgi:hypothetical protein
MRFIFSRTRLHFRYSINYKQSCFVPLIDFFAYKNNKAWLINISTWHKILLSWSSFPYPAGHWDGAWKKGHMLAGAENPIKKAEGSTQTTNRPSVQLPAFFRSLSLLSLQIGDT